MDAGNAKLSRGRRSDMHDLKTLVRLNEEAANVPYQVHPSVVNLRNSVGNCLSMPTIDGGCCIRLIGTLSRSWSGPYKRQMKAGTILRLCSR